MDEYASFIRGNSYATERNFNEEKWRKKEERREITFYMFSLERKKKRNFLE